MQHHRRRQRKQEQQDADQDQAARHAEDARQEGRADHQQAEPGGKQRGH
jgi:hypothetical protein